MPDRDRNGHFLKGHAPSNKGQGGRPRREDEETIKAALDAALPTTDVVAQLVACVRRRESWAVSLWLAYRWGKPRERVDLDATSGGQSLGDLLAQAAAVRDALPDAQEGEGDV